MLSRALFRLLIATAIGFASIRAFGEEPPGPRPQPQAPQQAEPTGPCTRAPGSAIKMMGVDLDVLRCQVQVLEATLGQAAASHARTQANEIILKGDLDATNKALAGSQGAIGWWAKCVKDPECVSWVNSGPAPKAEAKTPPKPPEGHPPLTSRTMPLPTPPPSDQFKNNREDESHAAPETPR